MRPRWKARCLHFSLVLLLLLLVISLYLLYSRGSFVSDSTLLRRVARLEAQNNKLHESLQALRGEGKGQRVEISLVEEEADSLELQREESPEKDGVPEGELGGGGNECETVHVAMVATGSQTIQRLMVVVKSILFYRRNPIHFHFLTDPRGKQVLSTIFRTWQLPEVNTSLYAVSEAVEHVKWIANTHYSGVFGLAKLTLPSLLPETLNSVIVLDTDIMLAADIGELWMYARELKRSKKLLALVENQSDWYLGKMWKGHNPWPAIGRGFNTGVTLLNLRQMRAKNWTRIWRSAAEDSLLMHSKAALADQDVINAALKKDESLVFILPCVWNVQLSENTLSDYCFKSAQNFKIIHWNSAAKLDVRNIYGPHFKNLYAMFEDYDSVLFRTHLSGCKNTTTLPAAGGLDELDTDPCLEMRREATLSRKVHPYYLNYSYVSEDESDVTLVAQLSVDRLHMLESLCTHWAGPLSVALYASDAEMRPVSAHIAASPILRNTNKLALHVVSKTGKYYPVNHLRNIALGYAETPYVYLSDIDFLPMPNLYHYLTEAVRVLGADKRALIVPAFESLLYRQDLPQNKSELLSMLKAGKLFTFRYHIWKQGHAPTNYVYWKNATHPYRVNWARDFEPYMVVSRDVTRYDERFIGFGWNKVSHVMELAAQGYELAVLPGAYMIHMPHAPSADILSYRQRETYRDCMAILKWEFKRQLEHKYSWEDRH